MHQLLLWFESKLKTRLQTLFILKKYLAILFLGLLFMSCENRWVFKGENFPPELGFKLANGQFEDEEGNLVISLSDTLKLNAKTSAEFYSFEMKYFDDNLVEITYEILKGDGELVQSNTENPQSGIIDISQEEVTLQYLPAEMGDHEIRFIAIDAFGEKSASVTIQLYFFDNSPSFKFRYLLNNSSEIINQTSETQVNVTVNETIVAEKDFVSDFWKK